MNKILILDNSKLMKGIITKILSRSGFYSIVDANDNTSAVKLYNATHPDLVAMDITKDIKKRINIVREILNINPMAKIIVITAMGQEDFMKQCIAMGVKDCIVRPYSEYRVLSAVLNALNNWKNSSGVFI